MFVQRAEIGGLAATGPVDIVLERVTRIDGGPRARTAVADALTLAFAAWDTDLLRQLLGRWGCTDVTVGGEGLPEAAQWEGGAGLGSLFEHPEEALLTVSLTCVLDPPQFGRLRKEAVRDPRLVDALADGARLSLRIGARFSPGFDALALDPLAVVVGDVPFAIAGADRPTWMSSFLRSLAGRFARGPVAPALWPERAASYTFADHQAVRRALGALRVAPPSLGEAVVVPEGLGILTANAIVPLWQYGEAASRVAGLVGAVHLSRAEILLVEDPPAGWEEWFTAQAEADGSPLEQVLLFGLPGGVTVG